MYNGIRDFVLNVFREKQHNSEHEIGFLTLKVKLPLTKTLDV
jgi:hypothetical protein